jgi:type VI secretion system protein
MSFLKRFAAPNTPHNRQDELEHVISNISAVLNTKQGFGSLVRSLGIGDYLERPGSRDAVATLKREIETEIGKFEPRILDTELELLGRTHDLHMAFDLTGRVADKRVKLRILFNAMFGNFVVERVTL